MKDKLNDNTAKIDELFDLAYYWISNERYRQAIQCFTEILELDPDNEIAMDERLICNSLINDHDLAINLCKRSTKSDKDNTLNNYKLGYAFFMRKNYIDTIKSLSNDIKLQINYCNSIFQRGVAYFMLGNYKRALYDFQKALTLDHNNCMIFAYIGQCNHLLGNLGKAIENFTESIILILSYMEKNEEKFNESISCLLIVHFLRAEARSDVGDDTGVLKCYEIAKEDYQFILQNPPYDKYLFTRSQERLNKINKILSRKSL